MSDGGGGSRGGGREGDWSCGSCGNRNYAFRSLCNRCKQPRLLVDPHTPRDSKWLPRAGDWICTGCSNNNYASRKNCKKCGLPKEEAAMPAMQMAGMAMPAYASYMARLQSLAASASAFKMNFGMTGNAALQQQLLASANWPYALAGRYGMQPSGWPFGSNNTNQFQGVPKDWRDGDWLCSCGFHNYSSRTECKECNAPVPSGIPSTTMKATASDPSSTLGIKRLASEELANDWDNKRLNPGNSDYLLSTAGSDNLLMGIQQGAGSSIGQTAYSKFDSGSSMTLPPGQAMSGLAGKGDSDQAIFEWMLHEETFCFMQISFADKMLIELRIACSPSQGKMARRRLDVQYLQQSQLCISCVLQQMQSSERSLSSPWCAIACLRLFLSILKLPRCFC